MSGLLSKATAAEDATKSEPVEEEAKSDAGLLGCQHSAKRGT